MEINKDHMTASLKRAWYSQKNKDMCRRAFDVAAVTVLAVPALVLATPAAIALSACNGWKKPLFVQERVGYKGELFNIYKLRTYDDNGKILKCAKTIRALKLDELPQLYNVAKGDMSVVGPRAQVHDDPITRLSWRQNEKPGMTSEAKNRGGNTMSHKDQAVWERRAQMKCNKMSVAGVIVYDFLVAFETPIAIWRQRNAPTSYDASGHCKSLNFGKGRKKLSKPVLFPLLRAA